MKKFIEIIAIVLIAVSVNYCNKQPQVVKKSAPKTEMVVAVKATPAMTATKTEAHASIFTILEKHSLLEWFLFGAILGAMIAFIWTGFGNLCQWIEDKLIDYEIYKRDREIEENKWHYIKNGKEIN